MSQARSSDDGSSDSSALDAEMIGAARREVEGADKPEGPNGLTLSTPGAARAFAVPPAENPTEQSKIERIMADQLETVKTRAGAWLAEFCKVAQKWAAENPEFF